MKKTNDARTCLVTKPTQSDIFIVLYQPEMMNAEQNADAGVGSSIPMPSYAYYLYNTINVLQLLLSA